MKALQKLTKGKKYGVFLDFEGTQFSHEIIAVGAVKCKLSPNGHIVHQKNYPTYKAYVKSLGPIGKIVTQITSITEETLRNGITLEQMFDDFLSFLNVDPKECVFFVFGSNDHKMIVDSISYSKPYNAMIGYSICKNIIDYLAFISQYCKDDNGNTYSLTSYLKLFGGTPFGVSHDPLNDAIDLMNLYRQVYISKEKLKEEYIKVLSHQRSLPQPIKDVISSLISGKNVTPKEFERRIKQFLE
ncbi:MAG: exonuclease domain-containing protein [Bacilli bacterium]